ncbi:MAG: hypothetical protein JWO96_160 [Candidatus Saccharibacteria bacterium]|nr:hypothetical protein [Candidatus Saccharibacteria bacterium]
MDVNHVQKSNLVKISLAVVALLVVISAGWYLSHSSSKKSALTSNTPVGWATYTNDNYGFQFIYPTFWGSPQLNVATGQTGKSYSVVFTQAAQLKQKISIHLESEDLTTKNCGGPSGECVVAYGLTKKNIESVPAGDKASLFKYDSNSYSLILSKPGLASINVYREISLPKIKVSAASMIYEINTTSSCPRNQLSQDKGCINESTYQTVNKVAESIKTL